MRGIRFNELIHPLGVFVPGRRRGVIRFRSLAEMDSYLLAERVNHAVCVARAIEKKNA